MNTLRSGLRGLLCLALVATFVMAGQYGAAATVTGAIVGGKTIIYNSGIPVYCTGDLWQIQTPSTVNINNGDDVVVEYRAYWWDNRTFFGAQKAYHNFTLEVTYDGSYYDEDFYPAYTYPLYYGSHTLSVTITAAQEGKVVQYRWSYHVIAPPPPAMWQCGPSWSSLNGSFTLI